MTGCRWRADLRLLLGWWWLVAPAVAAAAVALLYLDTAPPQVRHPWLALRLAEMLLPALAVGYGAQAIGIEHQEALWELRLSLPEGRARFALRRTTIALAGWALTAGATLVALDTWFTPLAPGPALAAALPGSLFLFGLALWAGAAVPHPLAGYLVPLAYFVVHVTLRASGIAGIALLPEWAVTGGTAALRAAAAAGEDVPILVGLSRWLHGLGGAAAMAAAVWTVARARVEGSRDPAQ